MPKEPTSLTIIRDSANRPSIANFVVETNSESLPKTDNSIGIDLGISTFATLSNEEKILAPKPLKNNLKKLGKFQRKFAKTQPGSKRRERLRLKIAKLSYGMLRKHAKVKDISYGMLRKRTDFLHKLSTDLIRKYDVIVLEDLNTSGMVKDSFVG